MNSKDLVLKYFNSWQQPSDFDEMRACVSDDVTFNGGEMMKVTGGDALKQMVSANPDPWTDVILLKSYFGDNQAVLFYEGRNSHNKTTRVAEYLTITNGRISDIVAVMDLPKPN